MAFASQKNVAPGESQDAILNAAAHVNAATLASRLGQTVRLIARVLATNGIAAEVEAADGGRLVVKVASGTPLTIGNTYQFLGRAETPAEFTEIATVEFGDFNMDNFNRMLNLQSQFPGIFNDRTQ